MALRRWSPTMQRSMASARSCIHILDSPASALSISNLSHHNLTHFSNEQSCKIVQHIWSILPGLLMHRTSGKQGLATLGLWVASLHVGTSGYEQMDRSAPYSVLSNLISCLRRKKLLGMAGRKHSVKRSFALDGTVSGTCHRGDTADGVSSRLTWTVGNMRLRSFLRTVTTLRVEL